MKKKISPEQRAASAERNKAFWALSPSDRMESFRVQAEKSLGRTFLTYEDAMAAVRGTVMVKMRPSK